MKIFTLIFTILMLLACDTKTKSPLTPEASNTGSANVTITLKSIGSLLKRETQDAVAEIELRQLLLTLESDSSDLIVDTIDVSGNNEIIVSKEYDDLPGNRNWTISAISYDTLNQTIHSDAATFTLPIGDTVTVQLNMAAQYSMIRAAFSPIQDSVTRLELVIDSVPVASKTIAKQLLVGSTEYLSFDYLQVSPDLTNSHARTIELNAYGEYRGVNMLLYTGSLTTSIISGLDTAYHVMLAWVGPESNGASMEVVLGNVGTVFVNGEFESSLPDTSAPQEAPYHEYFKNKFSISPEDIPTNSFMAYYFNDTNDSSLVASEPVDMPIIDFIYDYFHNIDSENFGVYYVGNLYFDTATAVEITIDQSHSNTIIYVNGVEVSNTTSNTISPYTFAAGNNIVEIEHYNNWHTTDVSVKFDPALPLATTENATALVASHPDVDIWYGGMYDCAQRYNKCDIDLGVTSKPTLLFFTSYHATEWDLEGEDTSDIIGVFVGDLSPTSRILGLPSHIPVFHIPGNVYNYDNRSQANSLVNSLTGRNLTGFSGIYDASSLVLETN